MSIKSAVTSSAQGAHFGAMLRFELFKARLNGNAYPSNLTGVPSKFQVESLMDIRRARTLFGEEAVIDWLSDGFSEDVVFWDIGAYHGHYSVVAALHGADIVAFEPVASNRERIQENIDLNGVGERVDLREQALSSTSTTVQFGGKDSSEYMIGGGDLTVETIRGDSIQPAPDVVKIDVEGHELDVLEGLEGHLAQINRIAVEVHDEDQVETVISQLHDAGMDVEEIGPRKRQHHVIGWE